MRAAAVPQDAPAASWPTRILRAIARFEDAVLRDTSEVSFERMESRLAHLEAVVLDADAGHPVRSAGQATANEP